MSKGIALQFKNKFNNVNKLIDQEKKITEVAYGISKKQKTVDFVSNYKKQILRGTYLFQHF